MNLTPRSAPVLVSVAGGKTHYAGKRHTRYSTADPEELCGALTWQPEWNYEITPKLATCRRCLRIAQNSPEMVLTLPANDGPRRWKSIARHGRRLRSSAVVVVVAA